MSASRPTTISGRRTGDTRGSSSRAFRLAEFEDTASRRRKQTQRASQEYRAGLPNRISKAKLETLNYKAIHAYKDRLRDRAQALQANQPEEAAALQYLAASFTNEGTHVPPDMDIDSLDMGGLSAEPVSSSDAPMSNDEDWELEEDEPGLPTNERLVHLRELWRRCRSSGRRGHYARGHGAYAEKLASMASRWQRVIPFLARAFLSWRHAPTESVRSHAQDVEEENEPELVRLQVVTWKQIEMREFCCRRGGDELLTHLVKHGFFPCTPDVPRLAISLELLEVLHHSRVRAYVSHEAFARILCDIHQRPYRRYFRIQLCQAYDAWVEMLVHLEGLVKKGFGHDTPNWRVLNSCSACEYRLDDEPVLPHSKLVAADGNNSSKRFLAAGYQDLRQFSSDYILGADFVDLYKDEKTSKSRSSGVNDSDVKAIPAAENVCTSKWKTWRAKDEQSHWMQALHATGNFLVTCRHGLVLWSADMIQSGELAKYSLACLSKILEVHGRGVAVGYDIGCEHSKTVARSALGPLAKALDLRFFVGAFHGYAHNRRCQLGFHPRFLGSAGLEDFETNERLFSKQNLAAHLYRHASQYHRHMALHFFWARWDEDRRGNMAEFLYENYRQALHILGTVQPAVVEFQRARGLTDDDFSRFLDEERAYFNNLDHEPEEDSLAFQYLDTLQALAEAKRKLELAGFDGFVHTTPETWASLGASQRARALERDYIGAIGTIERLEQLAQQFERLLCTARWTPDCVEWRQTEHDKTYREYNRALDVLESLVVQRLFELEKLDLRGTGYKMRRALGEAIHRRSESIRSALNKYNALATRVGRPTLTLQEVLAYSWLSDFALLRYSRDDVRDRQWSEPQVRAHLVQWLLVRCAQEEIRRLNVEARRVWTAIHVEPREMLGKIEDVQASGDSLLAAEMRRQLAFRQRVNQVVEARLLDIFALPGFCGITSIGKRAQQGIRGSSPGSAAEHQERTGPDDPSATIKAELPIEEGGLYDLAEGEVDDESQEEFERMSHALSQLGL